MLLQFSVTESGESHLTAVRLALLLDCGRNTGAVVRRAVEMLEQGCGSSSLLWLVALGSQAAAAGTPEGPAGATLDASPGPAVTRALRPSGTSQGSTTALQTSLSLISMTSPRHLQPQRAVLAPSFVEFDMSMEGYGYNRLSYNGNALY